MTQTTLIQCQRFLAKTFPDTKAQQWLKFDKVKNVQGQVVRRFRHAQLGVKGVIEDNNVLIVDNQPVANVNTWKENLIEYCSDPCYNGENFSLKEMVDMYLFMVLHGVQNNDCTVSFELIDGQECLVSDLNDDYDIPLTELEKLGYIRKPGHCANKFLSMYWNF